MEAKPRTSTLTTAEKEIVRIVPQRFRGAVEQILEGGRADEIRFIIDRPMQAAGRRGEQVFLQLKPFTKSEAKHFSTWAVKLLLAIVNNSSVGDSPLVE